MKTNRKLHKRSNHRAEGERAELQLYGDGYQWDGSTKFGLLMEHSPPQKPSPGANTA